MCSMKCNIMLILLKICHDYSTLYDNQDDIQDNNDVSPEHMDLIRDPECISCKGTRRAVPSQHSSLE